MRPLSIMRTAAQAPCRRAPLSSNVRRHTHPKRKAIAMNSRNRSRFTLPGLQVRLANEVEAIQISSLADKPLNLLQGQ